MRFIRFIKVGRLGEQPVLRLRFYRQRVLATRDVSRSYRLICEEFNMPKAWCYMVNEALLWSAAGLQSRMMRGMFLRAIRRTGARPGPFFGLHYLYMGI